MPVCLYIHNMQDSQTGQRICILNFISFCNLQPSYPHQYLGSCPVFASFTSMWFATRSLILMLSMTLTYFLDTG